MKLKQTVLAASMLLLSAVTFADPIIIDDGTYQLKNHPDGNAAPPPYGLRLDGLLNGNQGTIYTFDFNAEGSAMYMSRTGSTLEIFGTVFGGEDAGSAYAADSTAFWDIHFTYSDLGACGSDICAHTGSGTIASDAYGSFDLVSESGNHSYAFKLKYDHRGYSGISGLGWLNHCPSQGNDTEAGSCSTHLYASDWLFTVHAIPEPGTLALFSIGLLGVAAARRRQVKPVRLNA